MSREERDGDLSNRRRAAGKQPHNSFPCAFPCPVPHYSTLNGPLESAKCEVLMYSSKYFGCLICYHGVTK